MADARAFTAYEGQGAEYLTFYADDFGTGSATITYDETKSGNSAQVGLAVMLVSVSGGKSEIDLVTDGAVVLGKLIRVESDGACTVQVAGAMTLPGGDSATLTIGSKIVGDLGASSAPGYIRSVVSAGASYSQAESVEIAKARGIILSADVTTAVEVWL